MGAMLITLSGRCVTCGGALRLDGVFNGDMVRHNVAKTRFRCVSDHGVVIQLSPAEPLVRTLTKICEECQTLIKDPKPNQKYHKGRCAVKGAVRKAYA